MGKGKAIKSGLKYFLGMKDAKDFNGVITADSDGQHAVEDILRISECMNETEDKLILGMRDFGDRKRVPLKSRFGNIVTTAVFRILYGKRIADTQTGLRGIPKGLVKCFVDLSGDRFQYEMNMLIQCAVNHIEIKDVPIQTIYRNNNSETHFRPIQDSIAIYALMLRSFFAYTCASILSFFIDIGLFQLVLILCGLGNLTSKIFLSTIVARTGSAMLNYRMNKKVVFQSKAKGIWWKYLALCVIQMLISAALVSMASGLIYGRETFIKIVVDSCLFFLSYQIQRNFIFKNNLVE